MSRSTGLVLAAGGIAAANEVLFAPIAPGSKPGAIGQAEGHVAGALTTFNWRLIPATLVLALLLAGLETAAPGFAVGLGAMTLLSVLMVPVGNAASPIDNVVNMLGLKGN